MNCPTKDPEPSENPYFNQNPLVFDNDLSTNTSFNTLANRSKRPKLNMEATLDGANVSSGPSDPPPPRLLSTHVFAPSGSSNISARRRNSIAASLAAVFRPSSSNGEITYEHPAILNRKAYVTPGGTSIFDDSDGFEDGGYAYEMTPYRSKGISDLDNASSPKGEINYDVMSVGSRFPESPRTDTYSMPYGSGGSRKLSENIAWKEKIWAALLKYSSFIGPGLMISVAYIDPGNYSTDVAAGALFRFKLLFVVFLSNLIAMFLQCLAAKLGSVTGLDLAQNCRQHFPYWLCVILYILSEAAIIATDLAEVIGTAIALNILFHIPLVAGIAITMVDVIIVLWAYRPNSSIKFVRYFEFAVALLVGGVVICFCIELGNITGVTVGEVFDGFLPSHVLLSPKGLYYTCGILGATVMPHSLYLGSGLVQTRLRDYDESHGNFVNNDSVDDIKYRPTVQAIKHALSFSMIELCLSLLTFALFVNCAILIVSGAALSDTPGAADADLFSIHDMLSKSLSSAAGTIFALALLFSGQSAGIVCTLAGREFCSFYHDATLLLTFF